MGTCGKAVMKSCALAILAASSTCKRGRRFRLLFHYAPSFGTALRMQDILMTALMTCLYSKAGR